MDSACYSRNLGDAREDSFRGFGGFDVGLDGVVDDRGVLLDVEDFEGCDAGSEVVR